MIDQIVEQRKSRIGDQLYVEDSQSEHDSSIDKTGKANTGENVLAFIENANIKDEESSNSMRESKDVPVT